jgi:ABC-type uncharacterized transport system substrate-binding protein
MERKSMSSRADKLVHCRRQTGQPFNGYNSLWVAMVPLLVTFLVVSSSKSANAQKLYSVGSLNTADQFVTAFEGFTARMAELGYREKKNIRYHYYNSRGNAQLLTTLAEKLVQDNVDLIVTSSTTATVAAAKVTRKSRIPVLFLSAGNPQKLVTSYGGSGNNLAGISSASIELVDKRFELLKELAPATKRVAVAVDAKGINYKSNLAHSRKAAARFGFQLKEISYTSVDEIQKTVGEINWTVADAIFQPPDSLITEAMDSFVKQAIKEKMPLITSLLVNVRRGCLATYAANYRALGKQGAVLADKILKGVDPGSLPIEMPDKLNLVLNLKTAKAIGLEIPKDLLMRADEVFE